MDKSRSITGNIIVVDGLGEASQGLEALLSRAGHQVHIVTKADSVLENVQTHPTDLILLGVSSVDAGSIDLCRQIKASPILSDIPVVFLARAARPQDLDRLFAAGAADYVTGPFREAEVLARVETQLSLAAMKRELAEMEAELSQEAAARLQAEAALQDAEQSGLSLVESLSEVIYTASAEGMLTYVSPAVEAFLGVPPSEILGRQIGDFIHEDDLPRLGVQLQGALSGRNTACEYRMVTITGAVRWMRMSSQPAHEGDRLIGVQGVLTDITERIEAEEQFRRQNEFLNAVLESLTHPFYVIDAKDFTVQIANSAARIESRLGSATCHALTHDRSTPCSAGDHPCPVAEIQRTGKPVRVEHLHRDAEGRVRHVEVHGYPLFDDNGDLTRVIEYALDVTERKKAEEALRKSESLLRETQSLAKVGGWELDLETSAVRWTEEVYRIHELPLDFEPTLDNALAFYHPEDRPVLEQAVEAAAQTGETWDLELRLTTAGGNAIWIRAIGKAERANGRVARLSGTFQDITERRQAEMALRESEARWRSVTENSPDHVIILDRDLNIQFVNFASPGLTVEELLGTPLYAHVPEAQRPRIKRILEKILETCEPDTYETEYGTPDGGVICYESRVVPRILDGQTVGLAVNARDITAHKKAQQALQEAKEAAEQARSNEQERRRVAESLAGVMAALNSNQPLHRVLDHIAHQARDLLDNEAVAIYRLGDQPEAMSLQAAHGLRTDDDGLPIPRHHEAVQAAVALRRPVAIPDSPSHPLAGAEVPPRGRDSEPGVSQAGSSKTSLAVPIVIKDEIYGGIVMCRTGARQFSAEEMELGAVFGDQVALAVESARLREHLEESAVAAERNRLARDLHDSVTQALFSASLVAEVLPQVWQRDPAEAEKGLEELRFLTRGALAEMRTLLLELRPAALVKTKLDELLWQVTEATTSRAQLLATFEIEPVPTLPPEVHVTFYRVAQEALHNAAKHAGASHVTVGLRAVPPFCPDQSADWQGQVMLYVRDDGRGFTSSHARPDQLGLAIMRERAETIDARLTIDSRLGRGSQVTILWPEI